MLPIRSTRVVECELILQQWTSNINIPQSLIKLITSFALYALSVRITRKKSIKTETPNAHQLHIIQIQVYQKCIQSNTNQFIEPLCSLKFLNGSDSIKSEIENKPKNALSKHLFRNVSNCIDGNISIDSYNYPYQLWNNRDHWMEFAISGVNIGCKDDISKIVIYNATGTRLSEKIVGCDVDIIYDSNTIAHSFVIQSESAISTFHLNPIPKQIPFEIDCLIVGWTNARNTFDNDMIEMIGLYYMSPIEKHSVYVISGHWNNSFKYFEYKTETHKMLNQSTNYYAHSRTRLICIDSHLCKYILQVIYDSDLLYFYIAINQENTGLSFTENIKNACVFTLKLIDNKGIAPKYHLKCEDNNGNDAFWVGVNGNDETTAIHSVDSDDNNGFVKCGYSFVLNRYFDDIYLNYRDLFAIYCWNNNYYSDIDIENGWTSDSWHHRMESRFEFVSINNSDLFYVQMKYPGIRWNHWIGFELSQELDNKLRVRLYQNIEKRAVWKLVPCGLKGFNVKEKVFEIFMYLESQPLKQGWLCRNMDNVGHNCVNAHFLSEVQRDASKYSMRPLSLNNSKTVLTV